MFTIVGIGASAGGLRALEALTRRLSRDGMAYVILQHCAPGHQGILRDILARCTSLDVVTAQDGMHIDADRIYVVPPAVDVAVQQGVLRLSPPPPGRRGLRCSIDAFFQSLAADQGPQAIGIILSGAGTDGTRGLRAIKEEGGITFVQEPATAGQPGMPQSALAAGCADFCLGPGEIGGELVRLSRPPYTAAAAPDARGEPYQRCDSPRPSPYTAAAAPDARGELLRLLERAFGVDFAAYRQPTIEGRIQRRMALQRIDRMEDYLRHVQSSPAELKALYSDLLIGVTRFFRDQEVFEALKATVLPRLLAQRRPGVPLRIWVAGCATGEEAYSIAIAVLEHLGDQAPGRPVLIFATDVDEQALARARRAVYPQGIEADVSPERLQRFFSRSDRGYKVDRSVRDMVVFARSNLEKDSFYAHIDLVSCRNVLIYMQPPLQKKILRAFHDSLNPGAFLLLGTSESVNDSADLFSPVDWKSGLYVRKDTATSNQGE